ncbi:MULTISPECIES: hypothetical protein [Vibrio]|uniref:Uncharacterized protein n=1 Tax=Vibrio tasmaniensis TaxID=212663 RepID=A0A2N7NND4_9VIBR|nr:hypothetical protein [Vibrio tasmaniensis]PMO80315.1 hypothetical protein BCT01_08470 [Vibrio tasmaniensis]PMP17817.1 hypothetical protein BCS92_05260 [Vibrio tasmaniensis]TKG29022.1 hypothetical protein FC057_20260 [Vibrio tasmaniensis]TKG41579.1 hypothetical protein FC063_06890 [Vibrio tasmaniensis]TKG46228.1 hypothetical protein FC070_22355 [Vibrio tasmaniensis]
MKKEQSKSTKKTSNKVDSRKRNAALVCLLLFLCFVGYRVESELQIFGLSSDFASVNSEVESVFSKAELNPKVQSGVSTNIPKKPVTNQPKLNEVPILTAVAHDDLANLHLLAKRVKSEDEDAATLFGIQRLSIHAKRLRAMEVSLQKDINNDNYQAVKASVDTKRYQNGEVTNNGNAEKTLNPSNSGSLSDYTNNGDLDLSDSNGFRIESVTEAEVLGFSDLRVKSIIDQYIYITVGGEPYKNVKVGHTFAGRFMLMSIDHDERCVMVRDGQFEQLDSPELAKLCWN